MEGKEERQSDPAARQDTERDAYDPTNVMVDLFQKYKVCMCRVTVRSRAGDLANGAAFHIGDGWLVTAAHVLRDQDLVEVVPYRYSKPVAVRRAVYPSDDRVDLALLETSFELDHYMTMTRIHGIKDAWKEDHIVIGTHLDDWIGDELVLSRVLLMGYPPIPFASRPELVAAAGEVNAVADKRDGRSPFFLVSPIGRGGFSGGPVISEYGFLLGVMTETLYLADQPPELGFAAALSVEPLWDLLVENDIHPASNGEFVDYLQTLESDIREMQASPIWYAKCITCGFTEGPAPMAEAGAIADAHLVESPGCMTSLYIPGTKPEQ